MKNLIYLMILGFLTSCSTDPDPIAYGSDACHFCKMTIVSEAYSAQAVSTKGKQYKYDAIECMVNDLYQNDYEMAVMKVADFSRPGTMIEVEQALFIINDSIKSPMGENLAAMEKNSPDLKGKSETTYTWNELTNHFEEKGSTTIPTP